MMKKVSPLAAAAPLLLLVHGCRGPEPVQEPDYGRPLPPGTMALERVMDPSQYPDFGLDMGPRQDLIAAIDRSLNYLSKPSSKGFFPYLHISHQHTVRTLEAFRDLLASNPAPEELNRRIAAEYDVYRSVGWNGRGVVLFTGYCQPIFPASLKKTAVFRFPLYRVPDDLEKDEAGNCLGRRLPDGGLIPYYGRSEIDRGRVLEGQGLELCWLRDPFEVYVVHVQGSARLRLSDGPDYYAGYAAKNDKPYQSIAKALVADGRIRAQDLSLSAMQRYFRDHPQDLDRYLALNEHYVFFTERQEGPYGNLNEILTPHRSLAVDQAVFPRTGIAFVDTQVPAIGPGGSIVRRSFHQFLVGQDTGGAIRSAGRADIFYGTGDEPLLLAGHTRDEGRLHYIFLKPELMEPETATSPPGPATTASLGRLPRDP